MGGGSRARSWAREVAQRIYGEVLNGSLPGLDTDLSKALIEDRLSPGLKEELAGYARERALEYALQGLSEEEVRSRVAHDVNTRFREIVERDRKWVELSKPLIVPPQDLRNPAKRLLPEEVGTWIVRKGRYVYVTYWLRFPYDVSPSDGAEYEPFTVVLDSRIGRIVEYQTRVHWRIYRFRYDEVVHLGGKPVIAIADSGHTPIPLLRSNAMLRVFARYPDIWTLYVELLQLLRFRRSRFVPEPSIHIGPRRKEVSRWRRNPLSSPWFEEV